MNKQKEFQIVANNYLLRFFRQIKIFNVELGFSLRHMDGGQDDLKIKIKDQFVKKYENINVGRFIHKYGTIGVIHFFEDSLLPRHEFHIYKNDQIYEIEATDEDLKKDANEYLVEILKMIDGETPKDKNELENSNIVKNVTYTNIPEELSQPDMSLPKEQYIDALIKRKKIQEKIRNQK